MIAFLKWLLSLFASSEPQQSQDNAPDGVPLIAPSAWIAPQGAVMPSEPVIVAPEPVVPPAPGKTSLELWCQAAIQMEGAFEGNNNPGNVRYVPGTWMQKLATGQRKGFCVFPTYEVGYRVLEQVFVNAATGKSRIYRPTDTLYRFYEKYAPSSDGNNPSNYAEFVARVIGVSPSVEIRTLV